MTHINSLCDVDNAIIYNIPQCLIYNNLYSYLEKNLVKHHVRTIDCAAESPILTYLIIYYMEDDRGHLLDKHVFQRTNPSVVSRNALTRSLSAGTRQENSIAWNSLSHDKHILAKTV